jgi:type III restriction enzyme
MIDGIKYEKIGAKEYEMRLFEEYDIHVNDLTFTISKQDKTIYSNLVPLDSNVEYDFARECETRDDIEFYFKLPFWFKIQTPIGNYNPDWALIKKNERTVYFVAETKSAGQELKISEKRKIDCGKAHFNEFGDVEYRQVSTVGELN